MVSSLAMFAKPEDICDAPNGRDFSAVAVRFLSLSAGTASLGYGELVWDLQVR